MTIHRKKSKGIRIGGTFVHKHVVVLASLLAVIAYIVCTSFGHHEVASKLPDLVVPSILDKILDHFGEQA